MSSTTDRGAIQRTIRTGRWIAPRRGGYIPRPSAEKAESVADQVVPPAGGGGVGQLATHRRDAS